MAVGRSGLSCHRGTRNRHSPLRTPRRTSRLRDGSDVVTAPIYGDDTAVEFDPGSTASVHGSTAAAMHGSLRRRVRTALAVRLDCRQHSEYRTVRADRG